jgi:serine/threonine-protein kinase
MLMEHLQGSDLRALLGQRGPLPPEEVASYLLQVCDALAEAHGHGIIHRDLKPSNLFLVKRPNGSPCVKVIDFGISKIIASDGGANLTSSGVIIGSPFYMSPEQMRDAKNIDARSDIWSMGIVLHELATGKVPFEEKNYARTMWRAFNEEAAPPTQLRPDLPPWVDEIVARCLKKQPSQRYQDIEELATALRAATRAARGPVSLGRSSLRFWRRR